MGIGPPPWHMAMIGGREDMGVMLCEQLSSSVDVTDSSTPVRKSTEADANTAATSSAAITLITRGTKDVAVISMRVVKHATPTD